MTIAFAILLGELFDYETKKRYGIYIECGKYKKHFGWERLYKLS